ncbi:MAG: hypothetical protein WCJ45_09435 [bacterium]
MFNVPESKGRNLLPLCELKYNPFTSLVQIICSPLNVIFMLTLLPGLVFRIIAQMKSLPGAMKFTDEKSIPLFTRLDMMFSWIAFVTAYAIHSTPSKLRSIFLLVFMDYTQRYKFPISSVGFRGIFIS